MTTITANKDIFSALIAKHDIQRDLCKSFQKHVDAKDRNKAKEVFLELEEELKAHAAAEERHLYVPVMAFDEGLELSRHAIAEHHEMDELMATLGDGRTGDDRFFETANALIEETIHHLKEEENEFFKEAKKLLDADTQKRLGTLYQAEHDAYEARHED
ncbi:hemerythrin HHE cation-binding protein [Moraxella bovoculi]|uniref:Hemerythrin HHE cation binding domain-containing protein n=1 Tax=Moraxella bovoculi 237 TaxID=743974 RepID=A0A066UAP3_9GAMM|nr:hemerythrin domain-containing protein [Moraxella bovoculi]AKG14734.1 hemerythrin HHE cation-binding protein [Moraxella bovoculi]AKG16401.1 hemerythrin domain-containing protein [Moraxella bovoculi]AKG18144.1 hemerythrin HHE cation-binding protein [Moraxella bovoculi]KDN24511.1 hemerythrin HHE cation binding domain-containing protein [Moraxella bovoculi 237]NSM11175.1 hemerythrin domain-containing protein [Moraxella bovoculi]